MLESTREEPERAVKTVEPELGKQSLVAVRVVVKTTLVVPGCTLLPERKEGSGDKPDNANIDRSINYRQISIEAKRKIKG